MQDFQYYPDFCKLFQVNFDIPNIIMVFKNVNGNLVVGERSSAHEGLHILRFDILLEIRNCFSFPIPAAKFSSNKVMGIR